MAENQSGDPGRTPGTAEGDRETVEQDLNEKNQGDDTENPSRSAQGSNQQSTSDSRKETGKAVGE